MYVHVIRVNYSRICNKKEFLKIKIVNPEVGHSVRLPQIS